MQCSKLLSTGKTCRAHAIKGEALCYTHNPRAKQQQKESASRGGRANKPKHILDSLVITDTQSIEHLLTDTINRIRVVQPNGSMDIRTANAIGFLASKLLEVKKLNLTEDRLASLRNEDKQEHYRITEEEAAQMLLEIES